MAEYTITLRDVELPDGRKAVEFSDEAERLIHALAHKNVTPAFVTAVCLRTLWETNVLGALISHAATELKLSTFTSGMVRLSDEEEAQVRRDV